jgi:hypothetical protein
MRLSLAAVLGAVAALVAANAIGVAVAEAPTTATLRTVSVEGVGTLPIAQNANAETATNVYRQAMAAAVADGQVKAAFLTGKVGATLGAAQSLSEDGGEIECSSGGGEAEWEPYQGEQPDFGRARGVQAVAVAPAAASPTMSSGAARRVPAKRRRRHRRPLAKKATAPGCKLSAQVSLVYVIG